MLFYGFLRWVLRLSAGLFPGGEHRGHAHGQNRCGDPRHNVHVVAGAGAAGLGHGLGDGLILSGVRHREVGAQELAVDGVGGSISSAASLRFLFIFQLPAIIAFLSALFIIEFAPYSS